MRLVKKVLKGILIVLLLIIGSAGLILEKKYIESKRIEHIVKSDEVKKVTEDTLRKLDKNALTSEGKIKTYKIDFDKVKRNPMGGISIEIIINDNNSLSLGTTINKFNEDTGYEFGVLSLSPDLGKLISEE